MFSYFEPHFIEKFLWESVFFKFWPKSEMTRNKNRLFGRHFETVQRSFFFFRIVIFYSPYIYGVNFIAKFGWESAWFSTVGSLGPPPPSAPTGVKVPWSLKC